MTLIEIAQQARPGELFKHDADDAELYFDDDGELMASDDDDGDFAFTLKQEEILSNKWHFIW
jgi:hypothetical protein